LLDDASVEVEVEDSVAHRRRPCRQGAVEQSEEQQHDDEDERVLDPDQQLPDCADELHHGRPLIMPAAR